MEEHPTEANVNDISELKHDLIQAVIEHVGGADNLPRHDISGLWKRLGALILEIVRGANLDLETLNAIVETAEPGSFAEIKHLGPAEDQVEEVAIFSAAATIAAALLVRANTIRHSPRTVNGVAPPGISTTAVVASQPVSIAPTTPGPDVLIEKTSPKAPAQVQIRVNRNNPQMESELPRGNFLTVVGSNARLEEKVEALSYSLGSFFRHLIVLLGMVANVLLLFTALISAMEKLGAEMGRGPGVITAVSAFAVIFSLSCFAWWHSWPKIKRWARRRDEQD